MARQKDTFYFEGFRRSADYACQAAKLLSEVMHDFNPGQLRERMDTYLGEFEQHGTDNITVEM